MRKILKGMGVSKGCVTGKVKIIRNISEHDKFNAGDILVTRLTDPTMTAIMEKAGGIICDIGGMTSHPSILSREMGIPAIVSAKDATQILKNGDSIHMCGESGDIHLVEDDDK